MDIESFWTEGYAGQSPNCGHELAIFVAVLAKTFPENWDSKATSGGTLLAYLETMA